MKILLFVLSSCLLGNLFIIYNKRALDFISISSAFFLICKIYEIYSLRKTLLGKRMRWVSYFLKDLFFFLIILNLTVNLIHLYSYENDVKYFRTTELFIAGVLVVILCFRKFKILKKSLPSALTIYMLFPPASSLLSPRYLLYSEALLTLCVMIVWLVFQLSRKKFYFHFDGRVFLLVGIYLLFPISGYLQSSSIANLNEFLIANFIVVISAFIVSLPLKKLEQLKNVFKFFILFYLPKILIILLIPANSPSRGSVNVNLYAIVFEFLFFVVLYGIISKKDFKGRKWYLLSIFLLFLTILIVQSKSAIAGIMLVCLLSWFGYFLLKRFSVNSRILFLVFLSAFVVIVSLSLCYILFLTDSYSLKSREKVWELAIRGFEASLPNMFLGLGEYGSVYLMKYILVKDLDWIAILTDFDSNISQMHLHSEYVGLLYGSGILYLFFFLGISFYAIFRVTQNTREFKIFHAFGMALFCFLIHGITGPIASTIYTGFIFWFCFFNLTIPVSVIKNSFPENIKKFLNVFWILLVAFCVYFSFGNYLEKKIIQVFYKSYIFNPYIRLPESPREPLSFQTGEVSNAIRDIETKIKYFPTSTHFLVKLGDLYMLEYFALEKEEYLSKAAYFYCKAFQLRSIPGYYNNLVNLKRFNSIEPEKNCAFDLELSEKVKNFDPFQLIPEGVYY